MTSIPEESREAAERCRGSKRRLAAVRVRMKSALRSSVWRRAKRSADRRNSSRSCATWSRRRCAAQPTASRATPSRSRRSGAPTNFDPQADPIVRVEAMRLRRALDPLLREWRQARSGRDRSAARQLRADVPPCRAARRCEPGRASRAAASGTRRRRAARVARRELAAHRGLPRARGARRQHLWRA